MIEWDDIPAAERFELLATIREVREWRYGGVEPLRPLQPIRQAALALYEFRVRSRERTGDAHKPGSLSTTAKGTFRLPVTPPCHKGPSKPQGELFNDASAN